MPYRFAKQVEEVGEVAHARDKDRSARDAELAVSLVLLQHVIELSLHLVGLHRLLYFCKAVLLQEVQGLIAHQLRRIRVGQQLLLHLPHLQHVRCVTTHYYSRLH
jgi:hypothetical protein